MAAHTHSARGTTFPHLSDEDCFVMPAALHLLAESMNTAGHLLRN
jgi:hypothetical protein